MVWVKLTVPALPVNVPADTVPVVVTWLTLPLSGKLALPKATVPFTAEITFSVALVASRIDRLPVPVVMVVPFRVMLLVLPPPSMVMLPAVALMVEAVDWETVAPPRNTSPLACTLFAPSASVPTTPVPVAVRIRMPPLPVTLAVRFRPPVESYTSREYWVLTALPTLSKPNWVMVLPVLASTAEPPIALVEVPSVSILIFSAVLSACVMLPVTRPVVVVLSPIANVPFGVFTLGSIKSVVPRINTAPVALLLIVDSVPLNEMVPEVVPSLPVSVMVPPPLGLVRAEPNEPPVALMFPPA